jgi:hypothetical protein
MKKLSSIAIWTIIFGVIVAVQAYSAFGQTSRGDERRAAVYAAAHDVEANASSDEELYPGIEVAPTVSGLYATDGVNSHLAAMRIIWREAAERDTPAIRKRTPPVLRQVRRKPANRDHN